MANEYEPGLGELLRHLTDLVDGGADKVYREKGLRYRPRYTPVMRLLAGGSCTVSSITTRLAITQGAVSQTVKLMDEDKLIVRKAGSDARQTVISLTKSGQALLGTLQTHWDATLRAIDELEEELDAPLRIILTNAINLLEKKGFDERIKWVEEGGNNE